jgi:serine/threonine-protein kinase
LTTLCAHYLIACRQKLPKTMAGKIPQLYGATPRSTATPSSLESDYAGQTLGDRYELTSFLGRGGMGAVFMARHVVIGKRLAVKILDTARVSEERGFERLFREARMAAAIGHPNIIDVVDVGVSPGGDPYLVMEYLEGEDLSSFLLRRGPLSVAAACGILEPVLLALQAGHARGIVHRDLKPANVYLVRREDSAPTVKLIDFGIAKFLGPNERDKITLPGVLLGTPYYMPPEQASGVEDVDSRADLYAAGVTFYEMVTGKVPFEGGNYNETLLMITRDEAPAPVSPVEELPGDVIDVVLRALRKDPAHRYQSATEFLQALQALAAWTERSRAFAELGADIQVESSDGAASGSSTMLSPESPAGARQRAGREGGERSTARDRVVVDWAGRAESRAGSRRFLVAALSFLAVAIAAGLLSWWHARRDQARLPEPHAAEVTPGRAPIEHAPAAREAAIEAPRPQASAGVTSAPAAPASAELPNVAKIEAAPAARAPERSAPRSEPRMDALKRSGRNTFYTEKFE